MQEEITGYSAIGFVQFCGDPTPGAMGRKYAEQGKLNWVLTVSGGSDRRKAEDFFGFGGNPENRGKSFVELADSSAGNTCFDPGINCSEPNFQEVLP